MIERFANQRLILLTVLVFWSVETGAAGRLAAQVAKPVTPTMAFDAYGNARPPYRNRRSVGVFGNEAQRAILRGSQDFGRRVNQRGGFGVFSLAGDRGGFLSGVGGLVPAGRFTTRRLPAATRKGPRNRFGLAVRSGAVEGLAAIFQRNRGIVTSNAPVYGVLMRSGVNLSLRATIERTPGMPAVPRADHGIELRIDERLRTEVASAQVRIHGEAWAWFRAGRYRRAAQAFEVVTLLSGDDPRSRIGELFSHLSLGAPRTAMVILYGLAVRSANPFVVDLDMTEEFSEPRIVQSILSQGTGPAVEAAGADVRALRILILWYLGSREDARASAVRLADEFPGGSYADWPAFMERGSAGAKPDTVLPKP